LSEISDLFAKDPLHLTKEDRSQIIAKFRENREAFMLGQRVGRTVPVEKKPKEKKAPPGKLSLGDLGL
jgi:hypothetical protein